MTYTDMIRTHADAIKALPEDTRELVADALRVCAMDFVADALDNYAAADTAADIIRVLVPDADAADIFDPAAYDG